MDSKNTKIFFHLGLTKVASTYFQNLVFPNLEGIVYYPKHQFSRYRAVAASHAEGRFLFSTEKDRRIVEAVSEITKVVPTARVILFVRRHDDWLLSRYKYRIRKHGGETFREFYNPDGDSGIWRHDELLLQPKIEAIEKMCKTPPLVLTHDLLRADPDEFLRRLTTFMDTSVNPRTVRKRPVHTAFSEKQLIILRRWNRGRKYDPDAHGRSFAGRMWRKYNDFLLHAVAFLSMFIPTKLAGEKTLLTDDDIATLRRAREVFAADWQFCADYYDKFFGTK